jgi:hypothetical protein
MACYAPDPAPPNTVTEAPRATAADDTGRARGVVLVRVANAVRHGRDVRALVDGVSHFGEVAAASVTAYRAISGLSPSFAIGEAGQRRAATLPAQHPPFRDAHRYTVLLISATTAADALLLLEDDVSPDTTAARVRIVHAAPGTAPVQVHVVGPAAAVWPSVAYGTSSPYRRVTPGLVEFVVRIPPSADVMLRLPNVLLRQGTTTTIVLNGTASLAAFAMHDAVPPTARRR